MRHVEVSIDIRTKCSHVIAAFTDHAHLQKWWGVERSLVHKRVGGVYTLAWQVTEKGFGYVTSGTIKHYDPYQLLVVENIVYLNPEHSILGPMKLSIAAIQHETGCHVTIVQDGYQQGADWDWYYEAVKQAWPVVAQTLKDYLEAT